MRSNFKNLAGWIKNSFIDFPGAVSTVLFFSGCNLRCPYCHNYRFVSSSYKNENDYTQEIWEFLKKRKKLIDGVVITGGEPTLQPDIENIISDIRDMGYRIKLDTNGLLPERIKKFSPDYLAVDIKTIPSQYSSLLGSHIEKIDERLNQSIKIVKKMDENAEVRITVAPGIISRDVIISLKKLLKGVKRIYLQKADLTKKVLIPSFFESFNMPTQDQMRYYQQILNEERKCCFIRNE